MELMLEIVSYHRLSPEQESKKVYKNTEITFGRSANNEWYLPDPEKVISGLHAKIEKKIDDFYVTDCSTNGLFINRAVEPLGNGNVYKLQNEDLLTFGDYEVQVSIESKGNKVGLNTPPNIPVDVDIAPINMNSEFVKSENLANANSKRQATDYKSVDEHFQMPQAIPEEWNLPLLAKEKLEQPLNEFSQSVDTSPTAVIQKNENDNQSIQVSKDVSFSQVAKDASYKKHEVKESKDSELLSAFLEGISCNLNLKEQLTTELCKELGESFSELLVGLMLSLRNRSAIKNEFRINQTTFKHTENNPIKFSASIEDLIQNLYLTRSKSFLDAKRSIKEAYKDTEAHELSILAGTQGVFEGLLNQLSPQSIINREFQRNALDSFLPNQKQAKYWKLYSLLHEDLEQESSNSKNPVWHDDFVAAYDKKIKSLS